MIILSPTYSKNEKYCDILISLLDNYWPNHPKLYFVTDSGDNIKYENKIITENTKWVEMLYESLITLKQIESSCDYIFLILEDLFPIWDMDYNDLNKYLEISKKSNLNYVSFLTFDADWGKDNYRQFFGKDFYFIHNNFNYHSQLQPALWKYDHLIKTLEYALENKINDPWKFEFIKFSDDHYVADFRWPNILNGLLVGNLINYEALEKIQLPEGRKLKNSLIIDSISRNRYTRKLKKIISSFIN